MQNCGAVLGNHLDQNPDVNDNEAGGRSYDGYNKNVLEYNYIYRN